ncbi:hypothetical protein M3Y99_00711000 [Aphelenchoides fujianensis]|nr:hypothetical protein M3Y99_00711000 [Aphelenchoides fujianensis]
MALLFHVSEANRPPFERRPNRQIPSLRLLLVSGRSLAAFSDPTAFGMPSFLVRRRTTFELNKTFGRELEFPVSNDGIVALFRLCRELHSLQIHWFSPVRLRPGFAAEWGRISSTLRVHPALSEIHLKAMGLNKQTAQLLVNSLPESITKVDADGALVLPTLIAARSRTFDHYDFRPTCMYGDEYFVYLFRVNTRRLSFAFRWIDTIYLHDLEDCGPLGRNEHLEMLEVHSARLSVEDDRPVLRQLRLLNVHFKLVCHHQVITRTGDEDDLFSCFSSCRTTIRSYIRMLKAEGFGAKEKLEFRVNIAEDYGHRPKRLEEATREKLGLE